MPTCLPRHTILSKPAKALDEAAMQRLDATSLRIEVHAIVPSVANRRDRSIQIIGCNWIDAPLLYKVLARIATGELQPANLEIST